MFDFNVNSLNLFLSLIHFLSTVVAREAERSEEPFLIPMSYEDSPSEPLPSSNMSDPQACPTSEPDSESYGSLQAEDQSEDGALDLFKDTNKFGQIEYAENDTEELDSDSHVDMQEQNLMTASLESNIEQKDTQTQFCVVL